MGSDRTLMNPIVQGNIDVIEQVLSLLESLSAQQYTIVSTPILQSSIGTHCRHILDSYQALILAMDDRTELKTASGPTARLVDFNIKRRQHPLEQDKARAIDEFSGLLDWLHKPELSAALEDDLPKLRIRSEVTLKVKNSVTVESTLARELVMLSSHAIHHFAIIAIGVRLQAGDVDPRFGLASATASHQRDQRLELIEQ